MTSAPGRGATPDALADVARIDTLWGACLAASGGPFLFGSFCAADAMYAPVATRLDTYGFALDADARAYVDAINRAWMAYKSVATGTAPTDVSSGATSAAGDSAEEQTNGPAAQEGGQNE
mgnify:CR=1 FL=1